MKTKPFEKLSQAGKRVAIAKDAIGQLKIGKYIAHQGDWARVLDRGNRFIFLRDVVLNQDFLRAPNARCRCCEIGAAALSIIRLDNKFESTGSLGEEESRSLVGRFFSYRQIVLMENAFELGSGWYGDMVSGSTKARAVAFGRRYRDNDKRAIAIFQNIIRNKGTFKP